ncbi:MAG: SDR family NAD(P)-dependent oxidoreductase [Candidatus Hodarchaeota archaeon]
MDPFGVKDTVAIVTGGASGIGRGVVNLFVECGVKVVIVDLDEELDKCIERELLEKGFKGLFRQIDVSNSQQVTDLIETVTNHYKRIDILVNSAGVCGLSSYVDVIEEEWDWILNTNLKGTHLMCLAVAQIMVENGIKGRIVNLSSINDQIPVAGEAVYTTSKAAITGLTRSIALELAPYGINVNAIRPAAIDTPLLREVLEIPDLAHALIRQIPCGRFGKPEDVAKVILFLVSDLAEFITGAEVPVTGGMHLVDETSYNYFFEREMRHEEYLPDIPFYQPWKKYDLSKFRKHNKDVY